MKWNKFRLKTTTEAEDIVSSMHISAFIWRKRMTKKRFLQM